MAQRQIIKCWFDGLLQLRKGDIVEITKAYEEPYSTSGYTLRVNLMEILTTGSRHRASFDTNKLPGPILGRVMRSEVGYEVRTTFFDIEEGRFEDYVFVRTGEIKKGQAALIEIFTRRIDQYVKIWDPYISVDTIKLVSNVGSSITILILAEKITDIDAVIKEAEQLSNQVLIRKQPKRRHHDRFILTFGEGWSVGHSLKDFGTRTSLLAKLPFSHDAEWAFDDNWIRCQTIL